jgi:hypothetical protein
VWKLASYERAFAPAFASFPAASVGGGAGAGAALLPASSAAACQQQQRRALTADRVLDQLRLRYEREHNRCASLAAR